MVKDTSHMFITGPDVIETVTGEEVSFEELGGAVTHSSTSGVAHFAEGERGRTRSTTSRDCSRTSPPTTSRIRRASSRGMIPERTDDELGDIVPDAPRKPYDMKDVIGSVVDEGSFFEVQENFAKNIVVGFAPLDGHSVGIVANKPRVNAGTLDIESSQKGARFVRFCDAFNIPILTFEDVRVHAGNRSGAQRDHPPRCEVAVRLPEATVPLLTVTRKAYGGAYCVMSSKHIGGDVNYAWPTAEIAVMGPKGAVNALSRGIGRGRRPRARRQGSSTSRFAKPHTAADRGFVDDVIEPTETRARLIDDLTMLKGKRSGGT